VLTGSNAVAIRPGKVDRSPPAPAAPHGWRAACKGAYASRLPVHGALDHRLNLSLPYRGRNDARGASSRGSSDLRPSLDHGYPPAHAGPKRSISEWIQVVRFLANAGGRVITDCAVSATSLISRSRRTWRMTTLIAQALASERSTGSGVFYGTRFCSHILKNPARRMAGARAL